ncbi:hypothetical protein CYY_003621 [Polysphondylium violaceum]|uniref:Uncharacterized protein n=1 Tax=Polysphondylium violaceum TaxID=133409 RepID=A0A8J4PZE0_9MYCE|nr:hypothetical protein CYY_003621 [Polysphondylium violaceum]
MNTKSLLSIVICLLIATTIAVDVNDDVKASFCPTVKSHAMCVMAGLTCVWFKGKCRQNPYSVTEETEEVEIEEDGLEEATEEQIQGMLENDQWACNILKTPFKCAIGSMAGHCLWWGGKCHTV